MSGFIGLIYLRGLLGINTPEISKSYELVIDKAVFRATMSKNRFKLLNAALCLDDHTAGPGRWKMIDLLHLEFFKLFNINCRTPVTAGPYLVFSIYLFFI